MQQFVQTLERLRLQRLVEGGVELGGTLGVACLASVQLLVAFLHAFTILWLIIGQESPKCLQQVFVRRQNFGHGADKRVRVDL